MLFCMPTRLLLGLALGANPIMESISRLFYPRDTYGNPIIMNMHILCFVYRGNVLRTVGPFNDRSSRDLIMRFIELQDNILKLLQLSVECYRGKSKDNDNTYEAIGWADQMAASHGHGYTDISQAFRYEVRTMLILETRYGNASWMMS